MNRFIRVFCVASCTALLTVSVSAGEIILRPGRVEVVAAADAPEATLLAVQEMTNALASVFGVPVPVVNSPAGGGKNAAPTLMRHPAAHDGTVSIFLGDNDWSRAAGIDVAPLKRDGFRILAKGNRVYIAGRDDPKEKVLKSLRAGADARWAEQATVNGVYEFLERYAGVRYYFPGPLGTIFPRAGELKVPEGAFTSEPDYVTRYHTDWIHGPLSETVIPKSEMAYGIALQERRLRMQTQKIPCSHGQYQAKLPQRFGKEHPEYFRLNKDGSRCNTDTERRPFYNQAHICLTSDVWDEIYRDARSYLKGEPPSVRGMLRGTAPNYRCEWGWHAVGRKYYDIMPQDGLAPCQCARCQAAIAKAKDPKDWANELVWGHTADIARRLKAEGVPGYITQMAYYPYRNVPDVEIPDNVKVMVGQVGPWDTDEGLVKGRERVRKWGEKTHGAVWLWTYVGKFGTFTGTMTDVPCVTPRAMGRYWKDMKGLICGGYAEDDVERYFEHYLDIYVFAKVCWNLETDVEALLQEHNRLLFGAAAKPMDGVIRIMEACWKRIAANREDTAVGPIHKAPSDETLFSKYYNPKVIARLDALYAEAESLVPADSIEAKRVALYKEEFFASIRARAEAYRFISDVPRWRQFVAEHPERVLKNKFAARSGEIETAADGRGFTMRPKPGEKSACVAVAVPPCKYGRHYRLSWFLKPTDVKGTTAWDGCLATYAYGKDSVKECVSAPRAGNVLGTGDWVHQAVEFTPAESVRAAGAIRNTLNFHMVRVSGQLEIRDITVEEIPPPARKGPVAGKPAF